MPAIPRRWLELCRLIPGYDPVATARPGDWFDVEAAELACEFFPDQLTHIEGALAGTPFVLEPWQQAIIGCIFGWKAADGYRRYRMVLILVPRKNGKTPLVAGIANYILFCDGEVGAQNVCAAGDTEQASLLYRHAKGMIENNPELHQRAEIYAGIGQRAINYPELNSGMKVISSEAGTKHGGNGHLAVVDELHAQRSRELVDVLDTAMASANRKQPLMIYITTADFERPSICNEKHDYAREVRDGEREDPTFLPVIFEAANTDDWTSEDVWQRANPNLGISVSLQYMRSACARAKGSPAFENTFRRLHLNQRTEQDSRWLTAEAWAQTAVKAPRVWRSVKLKQLAGSACVAGLDLSSTRDMTALVLLFGNMDSGYELLPWFWVPYENVERRKPQYRALYEAWINQGFIRTTAGNVIDYAQIRREINGIGEQYGIREIAFDRLFQGAQMCTDLVDDGFDVVPFGQGFASMAAPTKSFEELVIAGKIHHGGNPVLAWMAANASVKEDEAGNKKVVKPERNSPLKVDGIVAAIMALGRAMQHRADGASVYSGGVGV